MKPRLIAAVVVTAALAVLGAGVETAFAQPASRAVPAPVKITVKTGEFFFKFSKPSVKAGTTVTFTVINTGAVAHNLSFSSIRKSTRLLSPGQRQVLKITFKKKGHYAYLCTVPRHAQAGMAGTFVVK